MVKNRSTFAHDLLWFGIRFRCLVGFFAFVRRVCSFFGLRSFLWNEKNGVLVKIRATIKSTFIARVDALSNVA